MTPVGQSTPPPRPAATCEPPDRLLAELVILHDSITSKIESMGAQVESAICQVRDPVYARHVDRLVFTLVELRALQARYPQVTAIERLATQLSTMVENDFDLVEVNPRHLDPFNPRLHKLVSEAESTDVMQRGLIKKTQRIGLARNGVRFKQFFAEVSRYSAPLNQSVS